MHVCAHVFGCQASFVITLHFVFWDRVSHRIWFGKTTWLVSFKHLPFKLLSLSRKRFPAHSGFDGCVFMFRRGFIGKFKDQTVWWGYGNGATGQELCGRESHSLIPDWMWKQVGRSLTIGRSGAESTHTYYFIGNAITVRRWCLRCPCTCAEMHTCRSEDKL